MPPFSEPTQADIPTLYREVSIEPNTFDDATRAFDVTWSTGARVLRRDWFGEKWYEELSLATGHVRLARFENRAPLLDAHRSWGSVRDAVIGVIERAWIETKDGQRIGRARVRLSSREDLAALWRDIRDRIVSKVSIGYDVFAWEVDEREENETPIYRAVDWEPAECSLVAIAADDLAGVRSKDGKDQGSGRSAPPLHRCTVTRARTENTMPPDAPIDPKNTQQRDAGGTPAAPASPAAAASNGNGERNAQPAAPAATAAPSERQAPAQNGDAAAASARAASITAACARAGLDAAFADGLIREQGLSTEAALARVIDKWGERSGQPSSSVAQVQVTADEREKVRAAAERALLARTGNPRYAIKDDDDGARSFGGMSLMEFGRELVLRGSAEGARRLRAIHDKRDQAGFMLGLARDGAMHTTSDFPLITANVANRVLRDTWTAQPRTWEPWTRKRDVNDFKTQTRLALGGAPKLEKVLQHGEIKRGKLTEIGESYRIWNWSIIVGLSREALINDDLDAFSRLPESFAVSSDATISDIVYALLTANATLAQDGVALFSDATHGNLGTTALSVDGLADAEMRLSKQKNPAGQFLNVAAKYLLVPSELRLAAWQLTASIVPNQVAQANPYTGITPITEPRLSLVSAKDYYVTGDPAAIDTVEVAFLAGSGRAPRVETRTGWDVDGQEFKCGVDVGAGVIDFRGMVKEDVAGG